MSSSFHIFCPIKCIRQQNGEDKADKSSVIYISVIPVLHFFIAPYYIFYRALLTSFSVKPINSSNGVPDSIIDISFKHIQGTMSSIFFNRQVYLSYKQALHKVYLSIDFLKNLNIDSVLLYFLNIP